MTAAVHSATTPRPVGHGYVDTGEVRTTRPSERKETTRPSKLAAKTFAKGTKLNTVGVGSLKVRVRKKPPTREEMLSRKKQNFKKAFETEVNKFMSIPGASLAMTAWTVAPVCGGSPVIIS